MTENFYFDTSIWIDIYDKRGYNGEIAKKLMERIILDNEIIIYSNLIIKELKDLGFSNYEINDMIEITKPDNIKRVHLTKQQAKEAKRLSKQRDVPFGDAVHAIIARDNEAQLVSRDWDFDKLKDVTKAKLPEDLI